MLSPPLFFAIYSNHISLFLHHFVSSVSLSAYLFFHSVFPVFPMSSPSFFLFHFSPLFPPFVSVSHNSPFLPSSFHSFQLLSSFYFHFPFQFYDSFLSLSFSFLFFICILLHSYSSLWRVITSCLRQRQKLCSTNANEWWENSVSPSHFWRRNCCEQKEDLGQSN